LVEGLSVGESEVSGIDGSGLGLGLGDHNDGLTEGVKGSSVGTGDAESSSLVGEPKMNGESPVGIVKRTG